MSSANGRVQTGMRAKDLKVGDYFRVIGAPLGSYVAADTLSVFRRVAEQPGDEKWPNHVRCIWARSFLSGQRGYCFFGVTDRVELLTEAVQ
jgi:hypothetical protein